MTYDEFIEVIESHVIRDDAPITSFIRRAETNLRPIAKHYLAEKVVTVPVVDGIVELPDDFQEMRQISGTMRYKPVSPTSSTLFGGECGYYRIGDVISIVGQADATVELIYFAAFEDLSETASNWLFERFPNVYISAVLKAFYQWERDAEGVQIESQALQEALALVAEDDKRGRQTGTIVMGGGTWQ